MGNLDNNVLEYIKDYPDLKFRVSYSYDSNRPEEISFAAQPHEFILLDEEGFKPSTFLLYGKLTFDLKMKVGFKGFSFDMNKELHNRIGLIYDAIEKEFLEKYKEIG